MVYRIRSGSNGRRHPFLLILYTQFDDPQFHGGNLHGISLDSEYTTLPTLFGGLFLYLLTSHEKPPIEVVSNLLRHILSVGN